DKYINIDDGSADELSGQLGIFTSARLYGFDGTAWQRIRIDEDKHILTARETIDSGEITGSIATTTPTFVLDLDVSKYSFFSLYLCNEFSSDDDLKYVLTYRAGELTVEGPIQGTLSAGARYQVHAKQIVCTKIKLALHTAAGANANYTLSYCLRK
ncbi:MAG: hypothetical protein DRQ46_10375, partial [Gammaproteobacteria bacterium]